MPLTAFRFAAAIVIAGLSVGSFAQSPSGEAVFKHACSTCHLPGSPAESDTPLTLDGRAVSREQLRRFTPEAILNALTNGKMQVQGASLSDTERRAVAEFASGRSFGSSSSGSATAVSNLCKNPRPMTDPARGPSWNGWGNGVSHTRFQPKSQGKLTAADLSKLKLKWAFGFANVASARVQPTVAGGRLFTASENSEVHALDPKTGCTYWTFKAQAGVRTALSVAPYRNAAGKRGYAVYFGDGKANAYAVDAQTGQQIWARKVDDHRAAAITGAPTVYGGRVFVPVQGLSEEGFAVANDYACCTFRGSVSALNADTGEVIWKTYTVEESKPRAKDKKGVQMYGPAGGGIWSSPTVDAERGLVYVATGNGYADPPQRMTDAIVALDFASGAVKWVRQATANDSWVLGCEARNAGNPACPDTLGPDYDFSASPALVRAKRRDLIIVPQKSSLAFALDPDKSGEIVWTYRFGQGSGMGGQWGGAIDGEQAYFGVADLLTPDPGGMRAVKLEDGSRVWEVPPQPKLCGEAKGCLAGQGGALTAIPGAVLSAGLDGGVRAYSAKDGSIIWMFDTNREFETVNGVKARGGSMDGAGPVPVDGMLYVSSGYGGIIGTPGNVLLAFAVE